MRARVFLKYQSPSCVDAKRLAKFFIAGGFHEICLGHDNVPKVRLLNWILFIHGC